MEDVDVGECLDENGSLFIRKLVMQLKQDYNFSLESNNSVIKIRKFTTSWHRQRFGSTAASIPLVKICVLGLLTGKIVSLCCEGRI